MNKQYSKLVSNQHVWFLRNFYDGHPQNSYSPVYEIYFKQHQNCLRTWANNAVKTHPSPGADFRGLLGGTDVLVEQCFECGTFGSSKGHFGEPGRLQSATRTDPACVRHFVSTNSLQVFLLRNYLPKDASTARKVSPNPLRRSFDAIARKIGSNSA